MEIVANRVNFDFEASIYKTIGTEKLVNQVSQNLEFIYFFINKRDECLLSSFSYKSEYLKKLSGFSCRTSPIVKQADIIKPWWGNLENIKLEQRLNSKLTSYKVLKDLDLLPNEIALINKDKAWSKSGRFIFKHPFLFSGAGNSKRLPPKRDLTFIVEPEFDILFNLGHRFDYKENTINHYITLSRASGSFAGGIFLEKNKLQSLLDLYKLDLEEIEKKIELVLSSYYLLGARDSLQIDSFIYRDKTEYKIYIGHDVQHRKTMGDFLLCLGDYFDQDNYIWLNLKEELPKLLLLSPPGKWKSYYLDISEYSLQLIASKNKIYGGLIDNIKRISL